MLLKYGEKWEIKLNTDKTTYILFSFDIEEFQFEGQKIPVSSTSFGSSNGISNNNKPFVNFNNSPTTKMIILDKVQCYE